MKTINLAPKAYLIMVLDRIFKSLVFLIIILVCSLFTKDIPYIKTYQGYLNILYLALLSLIFIYTFINPFLITKTTHLILKNDSVEYQRGLIFTKKSFIPIATLQQVETSTNIISEKLGGTSLIFNTAFLTIKTKVLDSVEAKQIVNFLLKQRTENNSSHEN